ncbi:hypothetical protein ACFVYA_32260 [Amycolatopsis sp. NPDC058278]|uniref:hypothetical protein n=1 Tax=Amycolatopsis sp. NPDC058278 TaxID=3346417 RepID=UPI0036D9233C
MAVVAQPGTTPVVGALAGGSAVRSHGEVATPNRRGPRRRFAAHLQDWRVTAKPELG